jgi:cell division protein FtsL
MKKTKRKMKFTKGEKFIYSLAFISFVLTIAIKIFGGASVGHLSVSVEKLENDKENASKKLESLTMQVNELVSFTEVESVVKDMGLSYNNKNVIVIKG